MTQAELLARVSEGLDTLNSWEQARHREWLRIDAMDYLLSPAQIKSLEKMLDDINDGKKVLTKEVADRAKLANDNQVKLYPSEIDFVHRISKLRFGIDKTSKAERAWLIKIENRIHKH